MSASTFMDALPLWALYLIVAAMILLSTEAGEVLRPATARRARSQAEVPIASGAMLGLLAGFLIISFREAGIRQRRSRPAAPRDRVPA